MKRHGVATPELMVVLAIGGIVAAALANVLQRQQRFFTTVAALVEQRVSLRDATAILPGELRALSPSGGDVLALSDSALDVRATIGTAVACDTIAGGGAIALAPSVNVARARLSSFTMSPQSGDVALVYDAREPATSSDDGWVPLMISAVSSATEVCAGSPFAGAAADGTSPRVQLRFATGVRVPSTVRPGAFVRILRRVRYRLYRAGTGTWYLGYSEWDGTAFNVVQPVSGPFASYSGTRSGLSLRYVDAAGAQLSAPSDAPRVARVEVVARGISRYALVDRGTVLADSQSVDVRVRNP